MQSSEMSIHMLTWVNSQLRQQMIMERVANRPQGMFAYLESHDLLRISGVVAAMFGGMMLMVVQAYIR